MKSVLILNAGYEPLQKVTVKHAIRMLVREVAVIEEAHEDKKIGDFPFPQVLRLVRYIKASWRKHAPKYSKRGLLQRDNRKCAYCLGEATTVDHIKPRRLGGKDEWMNTVAACLKCNGKKGSRTLEKSGLKLKFQPFEPSWIDIMA